MNSSVKYFMRLKHLLWWGDASFFACFWSVWRKGNYELTITNNHPRILPILKSRNPVQDNV